MKCVFALLVLIFAGCNEDKVPLQPHPGQFDMVAGHWFENEQTEYVFFSIQGLRPGQADLSWPAQFELATPGARVRGLDKGADGFGALNFQSTVHRHHLVQCAPGQGLRQLQFSRGPPGDPAHFAVPL